MNDSSLPITYKDLATFTALGGTFSNNNVVNCSGIACGKCPMNFTNSQKFTQCHIALHLTGIINQYPEVLI